MGLRGAALFVFGVDCGVVLAESASVCGFGDAVVFWTSGFGCCVAALVCLDLVWY